MTTFARRMCALAVLAAFTVGAAPTAALAQDKPKPAVKDPKDPVKPPAKKPGVIEIHEGKDGKFRFNIRDDEGKLLAMSSPSGFATRDDAHKALEVLKAVLPTAKVAAESK